MIVYKEDRVFMEEEDFYYWNIKENEYYDKKKVPQV